jgi:hypothetical protein
MTQGIAYAAPTQIAFDLDGPGGDYPDSTTVQYAKELTWGSDTAVVENMILNPNTPQQVVNTPSYFTANVGFTIAEGTNKYIRIDLIGGAKFQSTPRLSWDIVGDEKTRPANANNSDVQNYPVADIPNPQSSIAEGGAGSSYVVFEVNAFERDPDTREDIPRWLSFYVEVDEYELPTNACTTARYRLFEDAVDAQRENDEESLKDTWALVGDVRTPDASDVAMCFENALNDDYAVPNNAYASVDSEYTVFIHAASEFADHDETNYYDEQQSGNDANNDGGFDGVGAWNGSAASATTAGIGAIDTHRIVGIGKGYDLEDNKGLTFNNLDGGALTNVDVVGDEPVITVKGDFTFGEWSLRQVSTPTNPGASCNLGTDISPTSASSNTLVFESITEDQLEANDYVLCVDVDGMTSDVTDNLIVGSENPWMNTNGSMNRIGEASYTADLTWEQVAPAAISQGSGWNEEMGAQVELKDETMGEIIYDSITIDVPFMSTFASYNQRFHFTNNGPTPAKYVFEFIPEVRNGVQQAVPVDNQDGASLTGTIPANSSMVVQAGAIMGAFSGRASAKLHIGGEDEDIGVTTLIVNSQGDIEIQDLNANSLKAVKKNILDDALDSSLVNNP